MGLRKAEGLVQWYGTDRRLVMSLSIMSASWRNMLMTSGTKPSSCGG